MFFLLVALLHCASNDDVNTMIMRGSISGNWSIEFSEAPSSDNPSNERKIIRTYFCTVHRDSSSSVTANIYESPENMINSLGKYIIDFSEKKFSFNDGNETMNYGIVPTLGYHLFSTGIYKNYIFNFIFAAQYRYHLSLFDKETKQWFVITMIKEGVDRSEASNEFWMMFGGCFLIVMLYVFFYMNFKKINKLKADRDRAVVQEKVLPKPELEDVFVNEGTVKRRTAVIDTYQ